MSRGKELCQASQVVASRNQRKLGRGLLSNLAEADRGGKSVADTFSADSLFDGTAFAKEMFERLRRTAIANSPVGLAVGVT